MSKKVLITGITGFAGSYLANYLAKTKNFNLSGTYLFEDSLKNIQDIKNEINAVKVNLMDFEETQNLINSVRPDLVFHLAALTSPADSFKNPSETITNNISAEVNVLEALRQASLNEARILITSSADVYGKVLKEDLPMNEETKLMPTNPYSVSKIAQDYLGLQYFLSYNIKVIRVRPFNHIGPKQSPNFAVSSFAQKIAEIEKGRNKPVIYVGNLDTRRDFTDVRDMVKAYVLILEKGKEGEVYNIGSGVSYEMGDILNKLLVLSKVKIDVKIDQSLFRPTDTPELICDYTKMKRITNWSPQISIEQTLQDILDYWRKIV